jgi:flagellar protein FlaG
MNTISDRSLSSISITESSSLNAQTSAESKKVLVNEERQGQRLAPSVSVEKSAEIKRDVGRLNEQFKSNGSQLLFEVDERAERPVIKVLDTQKGEVVKQFPSEAFLEVSARIKSYLEKVTQHPDSNPEQMLGLLLNKNV